MKPSECPSGLREYPLVYTGSHDILLRIEAERLLIKEDAGIIPLYYSVNPYLFSDSVLTNVRYDANGKIILTDIMVKK